MDEQRLIERLQRRIDYAHKQVSVLTTEHGNNPTEKLNYYGGQCLGYWQGKLSAYEYIIDMIEIE